MSSLMLYFLCNCIWSIYCLQFFLFLFFLILDFSFLSKDKLCLLFLNSNVSSQVPLWWSRLFPTWASSIAHLKMSFLLINVTSYFRRLYFFVLWSSAWPVSSRPLTHDKIMHDSKKWPHDLGDKGKNHCFTRQSVWVCRSQTMGLCCWLAHISPI